MNRIPAGRKMKRRTARAMTHVRGPTLVLVCASLCACGFLSDLSPTERIAASVAAAAILLVLVQACMLVFLRRRVRELQTQFRMAGYAVRDAQSPPQQADLAALYEKALTGSLDRFPVSEVLQFLNSIRESGVLDIVDEEVATVHRLLICQGEVIDAFNGTSRGEAAVKEILGCETGSFTFIRGELPSEDRMIEKPTMTILMENFQSRDEAGMSLQMS